MRIERVFLSIAACVFLSLACASAALAVGSLGYYTGQNTPNTNPTNVQLAAAGGASWSLIPVYWGAIEETPNQYTWNGTCTGLAQGQPWCEGPGKTYFPQNLDFEVQQARASGLRIAFAVQPGTPQWDVNQDRWQQCKNPAGSPAPETLHMSLLCVPDNLGPFQNFMTALQQRYRPDAVQVWNEPNLISFSRDTTRYENGQPIRQGISPSAFYRQVFHPAYQALNGTTALSGQPTQILAPGTAAAPVRTANDKGTNYKEFLRAFVPITVQNGETNYTIAQHVYAFRGVTEGQCGRSFSPQSPCAQNDVNQQMIGTYFDAQSVAAANGMTRPVWATEVGISNATAPRSGTQTLVYGYNAQEQKDALTYFYCYVSQYWFNPPPVFVFRLVDWEPALDGSGGYGIVQAWPGSFNTNPGPIPQSAYSALHDVALGRC